jgi:HTH-type transcriptional regulator, competence development regulator
MSDPTPLGTNLRAARERLGLTLREVADRTAISNAYLSQIESGKIKEPSPSMLYRLADLYNESYARLMELAGYPVPHPGEAARSAHTHGRLGTVTHEEEAKLIEYLNFMRSRPRRPRP